MSAERVDFDTYYAEYMAKMATAIEKMSPRWGVKGYKAHDTSDGVAYAFTLTDSRKAVASIEDDGRGGEPRVYWNERGGPASEAFNAEAHALFGDGWMQDNMISAVLLRAGK